MRLIEILSGKISEEISDAKSYAKMALENRESYPDLAQTLYDLSQEEMNHVEKLHSAVAELINRYRAEHGDPPKEMMTLYDYLHRKHVAEAMSIRVKQGMYKE